MILFGAKAREDASAQSDIHPLTNSPVADWKLTYVTSMQSQSHHHLGKIVFAESTVIGSQRCRELVVGT